MIFHFLFMFLVVMPGCAIASSLVYHLSIHVWSILLVYFAESVSVLATKYLFICVRFLVAIGCNYSSERRKGNIFTSYFGGSVHIMSVKSNHVPAAVIDLLMYEKI
jgi:hypothetical protein